ncbi:YIF1A protein [Thecamonas trahens ATCC 50062]|uniref:Protein YIF1 n=1 Tax=Thecamonas trahens ATCC 50062 TaxID=461836 RepID=A0A0L0DDJ5_THETB|nr:YIF1A protein [Thecamonas trahens ATCC 50062]KNC50389.1 YIF1A protein [Thecamonas trahens ATCC 50062]|eukprot:XP_013756931.1 YIF1A protein [Thecamonas trahens ATCC 50062]
MLDPNSNYEFDALDTAPPGTPIGLPRSRGARPPRMAPTGAGMGMGMGMGMAGQDAADDAPGLGFDAAFSALGSGADPALAGAAALGGKMLAGEVSRMHSRIDRWIDLPALRFYFAVSNSYVLNKFKRLLLPFAFKEWTPRNASVSMEGTPRRLPPRDDINAPDLYIPSMALVTYVLLCAYVQGVQQRFTPEVLGATLTSALVALSIEVLVLKLGFYLTNSPRPLPFLDAVAFGGYKYVYIVLCSLIGINFGSMAFTGAIVVAGILSSVFLVRALKEFFGPVDRSLSKRNYLLIFVVALQFMLLFFMGAYYDTPARPTLPDGALEPAAAAATTAAAAVAAGAAGAGAAAKP